MEEFITSLGLKQVPRVQVYNNSCIYYTNLITTIFFTLTHVVLMLTVFSFWGQGDWLVIVYSGLQTAVGLYSLGLTIGELAVQATLLSFKRHIRWILFILVSISTLMISVSMGLYFSDKSIKA